MNATTISVRDNATDLTLDSVTFWLLLGFVAALQVSIAAANVLLALTFVCWVAAFIRDRAMPSAPRFFLVLAAYAAWTLVSSAQSFDPRESFIDDKQLLLFLIVPMVYDIARGVRAATVIDVLVTVGAASAAYGIIQYGVLHYDSLDKRPEGALSHYMTYSGILMLVVCAAVGRLLFGSRDRVWPALVMPALLVALALTLTRNAWIGTAVAVGVLFLFKDFRLIGLAPIVLATALVFAPASVTQRMESTFKAKDPSSQDRVAMLEIGVRMARDNPIFGVGPNLVPRVYERYRPAYAVNKVNPHLHNVPAQIMAERGIPALVLWLTLIAVLAISLLRVLRGGERMLGATGLAAVAAMLAAGMFEYNFGDSEFLMTFLVLVTLPFAAARGTGAADAGLPPNTRAAAAD